MSNTDDSSVVYRTINLYSPGQYILFFVDLPYLMKITRNCIAHEHIFI